MVNLSVCADESGVSPPPASFLMVFIISSFASCSDDKPFSCYWIRYGGYRILQLSLNVHLFDLYMSVMRLLSVPAVSAALFLTLKLVSVTGQTVSHPPSSFSPGSTDQDAGAHSQSDERHQDDPRGVPVLQHLREDELTAAQGHQPDDQHPQELPAAGREACLGAQQVPQHT